MLRELGAGAHPRGRRRRRHDRAARDRGAAGLRRRAHLLARGRPQARPRRHDRGRDRARARAARARRSSSARSVRATTSRSPARSRRSSASDDDAGAARDAAQGRGARASTARRSSASPAPAAPASRAHRRAADALRAAFPGSQHRRRRDGPDAPAQRRRAARRPHPHELARAPSRCSCARSRRAASTSRPARCWPTCSNLLRYAGFDLVVVETAGIGQSDSEIVDLVDVPMYVMTSEYGAASQLEKIDMLDFAELIVLNKFDKRGAEDALRDVRKQWRRNHVAFQLPDDEVPVFPTIASRFNDPGVNRLFAALCARLDAEAGRAQRAGTSRIRARPSCVERHALVPGGAHALPRGDRRQRPARARPTSSTASQAASRAHSLHEALQRARRPAAAGSRSTAIARRRARRRRRRRAARGCASAYNDALDAVGAEALDAAARMAGAREVRAPTTEYAYDVRGREIRGDNYTRVAEPPRRSRSSRCRSYRDWGELLAFLMNENLPGAFPYTGGRLPVPARGRRPDAHVRGRRHAGAHQPPLPLPRRAATAPRGCRPRSTR